MSYQLRSRSLVTHLEAWLAEKDPKEHKTRGALLQDHPRIKNLPGLLRRNGLLQTVLFLQSKSAGKSESAANERRLWQLLESQLGKGAPFTVKLNAKDLANLPAPRYLFLSERAIEIAILLTRLLDAQAALDAHEAPEAP